MNRIHRRELPRAIALPRIDWMERMMYVCVVLVAIFIWILWAILFPTVSSVPRAAAQSIAAADSSATANLVRSVSGVTVGAITRPPFSAKGTMVVARHDNLQVFEYTSTSLAAKDVVEFTKAYEKIKETNAWKTSMHLYQHDGLVVFYMGKNESLITSLTSAMGMPAIGASAFLVK